MFINEIILAICIILLYSLVLVFSRLFGRIGLTAWVAIATILANIEVLVLIHAFGIDMTLGNILFASTFLATDILSELYGEKEAKTAANIGIFASASFLLVSLSWQLYIPAEQDVNAVYLKELFNGQPRVIIASLVVFAVVEKLDVFLYHKIWHYTEHRFNDKRRFLWLRNNLATLISQLVNSFLYTFLAFYNTYSTKSVIDIAVSSMLIFVITSLLDTPFLYLARTYFFNVDSTAPTPDNISVK